MSPEVTLVFAQSLDGRIALLRSRTQLSSRVGLQRAHRFRAENDAVLVGSSTVKIDDPQLTVRYVPGNHPKRIVLSSRLDIPTSARLFADGEPVLVIGTEGVANENKIRELRETGAEVRLVSARSDGRVALPDALRVISEWGVRRLLVEGGASVLSSFIRERLADRVAIEIVPKFLGETGVCCVGDLTVKRIEDCPTLTELSVEHLESSIFVRGKLEKRTQDRD